jgi:hypothetical protein
MAKVDGWNYTEDKMDTDDKPHAQSRHLKVWKILGGVVNATMIVLFAYGVFRFHDGPIHPCPEGRYCGKQGQPHTLRDYQAFQFWESGMMLVWPLGMVAMY